MLPPRSGRTLEQKKKGGLVHQTHTEGEGWYTRHTQLSYWSMLVQINS